MLRVGEERRRVDALADPQLVLGDDLVPDNAQYRAGDTSRDVGGMPVLNELAHTLEPGERGTGPDHHRDADTSQVLGALQSVRIFLRRRPPRQPEPKEHYGAGRYVRQVVDR